MTEKSKITRLRPVRTCVICQKNKTTQKFYPFCSSRCANIDLNRWLSGAYVIPGDEEEEGEEETLYHREEGS